MTAPTIPASGARGGVASTRFHQLMLAGAAACVILLLLPQALQGPWFLLFGWTIVVTVGRRVRTLPPTIRRSAWCAVLAGACSLTGAMVRGAESAITGVEYPFPAVADLFSVMSYPLFMAAILLIVVGRIGRPSTDLVIDALTAGLAVSMLQWQLVLLPYLETAATGGAALVVNVLYGALSTLLVMAATMILIAGGHRSTSNRLLAAGLSSVVLLDLTATLVTAGRVPDTARLVLAMLVFLLGGAGLVHPSVTGLLERPRSRAHLRRLTVTRIAVLGLALLVPPTLLTVALATGSTGSMWLPVIGSLLLAPLVVLRLGRLVRSNEATAEIEATLRNVSERLVSVDSDDEVEQIVGAGAVALLPTAAIAPQFILIDGTGSPASGTARRGHPATAPLVRSAVAEHRTGGRRLATGQLIDLGVPGPARWNAGLVLVRGQLRAALLVETSACTPEQLAGIPALCRDAAFALRSVEQTELAVRRRSEERFGALIDNSSDIVLVLAEDRRPTYVSPVAARLLGYPTDYLQTLDVLDLIHPDDAASAADLASAVRQGRRMSSEIRLRHVAGTFHWFEIIGTDLSDDPNVNGIVLTAREIGDRKAAEERLTLSEARFKSLVQHSSDLVLAVEPNEGVRYVSPSVTTITGHDAAAVRSMRLDEVFPNSGVDWSTALHATSCRNGSRPGLLSFAFDDASGRRRHVEATVTDLRADPAVGAYVLNGRDVTERAAMLDRLQHQATHDSLTGLANRVKATSELAAILERNPGSSSVAVISLDLDDFKNTNDSLGHAEGDTVLRALAARVEDTINETDLAVRSGGDEFVVIVERGHGEALIVELAQRLQSVLAQPLPIAGRTLTITASAGLAFDHDRSSSAEDLLRNADTAMYRAKHLARQLGTPQVTIFEAAMHSDSFDRFELRADLARALVSDQLEAYYQPVVDIETRRIIGAEALVRWNHPKRGLLGPGVFVPLAEESGLIRDLGTWMRNRACRDLAAWRAADPDVAGDLSVAVNVSAAELQGDELIGSVIDTLALNDLPANKLTLEITESSLLGDTDLVRNRMDQLRALGTRLAIDDFGTGYSSLGYIHRFEFDVLKVDRSFVEALELPTNQRIVEAVLDLAGEVGATVVAEGIEEDTQAEALAALGCEIGQGYLYSRPVPAAAFRHLLQAQRIDLR